jgi:hypothetical protein
VPSNFKPPVGGSLAAVDSADAAYDERCTIIEGVVSPSGQGGWSGRDSGYDVHCFAFAGWRRPGQPLVEREITLLRPVPPSRDGQGREENIFERFPAYSIQRFSVLLSKDQTRAVVERALTIDTPDEALRLLSDRLRQPVIISTERFGDLVLNPRVDWFEGKARWNGKTISISFERDENKAIDDAVETAERLWSDQAGWKRKVDDFAVKKLLPLKNEAWLGEGERELTAKGFKARMELDSITVAADGRFEFWHDDGDLFCGHAIQISGNLKDGLTDADIRG